MAVRSWPALSCILRRPGRPSLVVPLACSSTTLLSQFQAVQTVLPASPRHRQDYLKGSLLAPSQPSFVRHVRISTTRPLLAKSACKILHSHQHHRNPLSIGGINASTPLPLFSSIGHIRHRLRGSVEPSAEPLIASPPSLPPLGGCIS